MTTYFFLVTSNVKHNGEFFAKGSILNGDSASYVGECFQPLNAETQEEAEAEVVEMQSSVASPEEEVSENNTWGPRADDVHSAGTMATPNLKQEEEPKAGFLGKLFGGKKEEEAEAEVYTGPMVKVRFLKDYEVINEKSEKTGEVITAGTESEVPEPTVQYLVEAGEVEVIVDSQ